jgi:hypothetical protein
VPRQAISTNSKAATTTTSTTGRAQRPASPQSPGRNPHVPAPTSPLASPGPLRQLEPQARTRLGHRTQFHPHAHPQPQAPIQRGNQSQITSTSPEQEVAHPDATHLTRRRLHQPDRSEQGRGNQRPTAARRQHPTTIIQTAQIQHSHRPQNYRYIAPRASRQRLHHRRTRRTRDIITPQQQ